MSLRPALTPEQVREARTERAAGESVARLCRRFGVDKSSMQSALYGRPPYRGIGDPPALKPGRLLADLPLTEEEVGQARRAAQKGDNVSSIARQLEVARKTVQLAVLGKGPYRLFRVPPPLKDLRSHREAIMTVGQVRRVRRLRLGGASILAIVKESGVGEGTVRNALYGTNAYTGIDDPPPVRLVGPAAGLGLTLEQVRVARDRVRRGETTYHVARELGVSQTLVQRAVYGQGAYAGIREPPPIVPVWRRRTFTDEQVRDLRRRRKAGASFFVLARETGAGFEVVRRAVYGRGAYRGIWYPFPPETGPDGGSPALKPAEVAVMRRAARRGVRTDVLAQQHRVSIATARNALFGHVPYHRVQDPPPLVPKHVASRPLSPEQVGRARRMRLEGRNVIEIARRLGSTRPIVESALLGRGRTWEVRDPPPLAPQEVHRRSKLSPIQVAEMRNLAHGGVGIPELSRRFHVSVPTARDALFGRGSYSGPSGHPPLDPSRRPRPGALTDREVRAVRLLRKRGVRAEEVARQLEVSIATVRAAAWGRPPYGLVDEPGPLPRRRRGSRPTLSAKEVDTLRQAAKRGAEPRDLARSFRVSPPTVASAAYGLGAYRHRGKVPPLPPRSFHGGRNARLSEADAGEVRRLARNGKDVSTLAARFRVSGTTVRAVVLGRGTYADVRAPPPLGKGEWVVSPPARISSATPSSRSLPRARGSLAGVRAPFTAKEVRTLRRDALAGISAAGLAKRTGASLNLVRRVLYGRGAYAQVRDPPPLRPSDLRRPRAPLLVAAPPAERKRPGLTAPQVREARRRVAAGASPPVLARRLGVSPHVLGNALYGRGRFAAIDDPAPLVPGWRGGPALSAKARGREVEAATPRPRLPDGSPLTRFAGWDRRSARRALRDPESLLHDPGFVEEMLKGAGTPTGEAPPAQRARRVKGR